MTTTSPSSTPFLTKHTNSWMICFWQFELREILVRKRKDHFDGHGSRTNRVHSKKMHPHKTGNTNLTTTSFDVGNLCHLVQDLICYVCFCCILDAQYFLFFTLMSFECYFEIICCLGVYLPRLIVCYPIEVQSFSVTTKNLLLFEFSFFENIRVLCYCFRFGTIQNDLVILQRWI